MSSTISFMEFEKVDLRVGEIKVVEDFPRAKKPAYKVQIDFGEEIGTRWSSVQATHYAKDELLGKQVVCVINFPPKNIAGFMSECLVVGVPGTDGNVSLLMPSKPAINGGKAY